MTVRQIFMRVRQTETSRRNHHRSPVSSNNLVTRSYTCAQLIAGSFRVSLLIDLAVADPGFAGRGH